MSENDTIKIDAYELRQAEIRRLAVKLVGRCESWGCFDSFWPHVWTKLDKKQFEDAIAAELDKWLKELPWLAN